MAQSTERKQKSVPSAIETKCHFRSLDGVRGLAILLAFLYHSFLYRFQDSAISSRAAHWIFIRCWIGVDMFFVLSGFLITGILLRSKASASYYKVFYIRRVLRIAPLY
jgi:peptidoglycan/LPS O-acetylase OafA/YrhL